MAACEGTLMAVMAGRGRLLRALSWVTGPAPSAGPATSPVAANASAAASLGETPLVLHCCGVPFRPQSCQVAMVWVSCFSSYRG